MKFAWVLNLDADLELARLPSGRAGCRLAGPTDVPAAETDP